MSINFTQIVIYLLTYSISSIIYYALTLSDSHCSDLCCSTLTLTLPPPPPLHTHTHTLCRYASVTWFGSPRYPLGDNRLEVVVSRDGTALDREIQSCVIRITQIDPSYIVVEPDGVNLRMMRQSGYDTVP